MTDAPRSSTGLGLTAGLAAAMLLGTVTNAEAFLFGPRRARATRAAYVPTFYVPAYYTPALYTPAYYTPAVPVASTVATPVSCPSCQATPTVAASVPAATAYQVPAAAAPSACPTGGCTPTPQTLAVTQTCMTQRCYMAPVTSYQLQTAYDNVTEYQTSTYLEPVTTMRTSSYYNPCTCSYYQVATPETNFVTRQAVTPVTKTVARNYYAPVTTYQQQCVQVPEQRVQYYVPAGSAAAAAPAATPSLYTPAVAAPAPVAAAPTMSNYWTPTAPAQAPAVASSPTTQNFYLSPQINTAPTVQPVPAAPQQQGPPQVSAGTPNGYERNYGPAQPDGSRVLIERYYGPNGQVVDERRRVIPPGQDVPPPNANGYEQQSGYDNYRVPAAPGQTLTQLPASDFTPSPYYR